MGIYLDTSALAKLYRPEIGTARVERIITESSGTYFISRLGALEMHSVLAQKIRAGEISAFDAALVLKRFRRDVRLRRFPALALNVRHYEMAEALVDAYGPTHGLRTLNSLHLAGAMDLQAAKLINSIVVADKILARVAESVGLDAIDPEYRSSDKCPSQRVAVPGDASHRGWRSSSYRQSRFPARHRSIKREH